MENQKKLCWHSCKILPELIEDLTVSLYNSFATITSDGFENKTSFPIGQVRASLKSSNYISLLYDTAGIIPIQGFALLSVPNQFIENKKLVWINKICLNYSFQGKGYGITDMLYELTEKQNIHVGFLGCKTQNPFLMKKIERLSELCFPFHKSYYDSSIGKLGITLLTLAINNVPQLKKSYNATLASHVGMGFLDIPPGILRNEYEACIAPDIPYETVASYPTEKYLIKNNFCRENGDCVVIISKLK